MVTGGLGAGKQEGECRVSEWSIGGSGVGGGRLKAREEA